MKKTDTGIIKRSVNNFQTLLKNLNENLWY